MSRFTIFTRSVIKNIQQNKFPTAVVVGLLSANIIYKYHHKVTTFQLSIDCICVFHAVRLFVMCWW